MSDILKNSHEFSKFYHINTFFFDESHKKFICIFKQIKSTTNAIQIFNGSLHMIF